MRRYFKITKVETNEKLFSASLHQAFPIKHPELKT